MKRVMVIKNSVVEIQIPVMNHKTQPVKSNSGISIDYSGAVLCQNILYIRWLLLSSSSSLLLLLLSFLLLLSLSSGCFISQVKRYLKNIGLSFCELLWITNRVIGNWINFDYSTFGCPFEFRRSPSESSNWLNDVSE